LLGRPKPGALGAKFIDFVQHALQQFLGSLAPKLMKLKDFASLAICWRR